jgi:uncharacterized protein YdaT
MKRYHVVSNDGSWKVKGENSARASSVHETKAEAVNAARELAKSQGNTQVIIHKQNGRIQEERTYGHDPFPPEG